MKNNSEPVTDFNDVEKLIDKINDEFSTAAHLSVDNLFKEFIEPSLNRLKEISDNSQEIIDTINGDILNKEKISNVFREKQKYLNKFLSIVKDEKTQRKNSGEILTNFLNPLENLSTNYHEKIIVYQQENRFQSLTDDSLRIKSLKKVKKFFRFFHKKWKQQIKLKEIINFYFLGYFVQKSLPILNRFERIRSLIHLSEKRIINLTTNLINPEN